MTGAVDLWEWWGRRRAARVVDPPEEYVRRQSWPTAAVAGPLVALVVALGVVATPFVLPASAMESIGITPGPNQVTNWSSFNYSGYQAQAAYPEYRALVQTMEHVGATDGCGQAMWQYDPSLNRFGTTQALMLLPYWSSGCIGSMEGLLFESSATTPYHFLNQAELSVSPSEAMVGLDYSSLNVPAGIQHLQLLGVRYFMASSPQVQEAASADPSLRLVAETGPWTSEPGGRLDHDDMEDLRGPECAAGDRAGQRSGGGGRGRARPSRRGSPPRRVGTTTRPAGTSSWPRAARPPGPECRSAIRSPPRHARAQDTGQRGRARRITR